MSPFCKIPVTLFPYYNWSKSVGSCAGRQWFLLKVVCYSPFRGLFSAVGDNIVVNSGQTLTSVTTTCFVVIMRRMLSHLRLEYKLDLQQKLTRSSGGMGEEGSSVSLWPYHKTVVLQFFFWMPLKYFSTELMGILCCDERKLLKILAGLAGD